MFEQNKKEESKLQLNIVLKSLIGFFPVYGNYTKDINDF